MAQPQNPPPRNDPQKGIHGTSKTRRALRAAYVSQEDAGPSLQFTKKGNRPVEHWAVDKGFWNHQNYDPIKRKNAKLGVIM